MDITTKSARSTNQMRQDIFGPQLQAFFEDATRTGEGATPMDATEAVGCSKQRVYAWVKQNRGNLRGVGTDANGATRYVWAEGRGNAYAAGMPAVDSDAARRPTRNRSMVGVEVGAILTVTRMQLVEGRVVLELTGPQGERFTAVPG